MIFKNNNFIRSCNGKIPFRIPKEADDFIYAAGLNNDANLNTGGLYDAKTARLAIGILVSGFKAVKDVGQTLSFYDRIVAGYLFITGVQATDALNFKNPAILPLTFFGTNTFSGTGWKPTLGSGYATAEVTRDMFALNSMSAFYYSGTNDNTISGAPTELSFSGQGAFNVYGNTELAFGQISGVNINTRATSQTSTDSVFTFPASANRPTTGLLGSSRVNSSQMIRLRNYDGIVETLSNSVNTNFRDLANVNAKLRLNHQMNQTGALTSFSNRQCRLAIVAAGVTAVEMAQINHIVTFYQGLLNRK